MASIPAQFIDEVPEYECRDGRMHIKMAGAELVMPIHVFRAGMAKANRSLDAWFEGQGRVVQFKR